MLSLHVFVLAILHALWVSADVSSDQKNCSCGFVDNQTNELFTESIIVYFNETFTLPDDFVVESYAQKYEQDWNAIYRQGAAPSNVRFDDKESLQLFVQPPGDNHLVNGASVRTSRRDIQHGSFRTLMKSPRRATRGSALSMMWKYNETEVTELSVMNANTALDGWVGTFVNNEFTTRDLGVNYTQLLEQPAANRNYTTLSGGLSNGSVDPWDYTEYRVDWTSDYINFYVGGNLSRRVLHEDNEGMPSVPSAFYLKHWSTGNRFSMRGPPVRESVANVGWIRMFFNSSSTTDDIQEDFAARCTLVDACLMDDATLRGSTPRSDAATNKWEQESRKNGKRMPALWVSIACLALSTFLVVATLVRRATAPKSNGHGPALAVATSSISNGAEHRFKNPLAPRDHTLDSAKGSSRNSTTTLQNTSSNRDSVDDLAIEAIGPSTSSLAFGAITPRGSPTRQNSVNFDSRGTTPRILSPRSSILNSTQPDPSQPKLGQDSQLTLAGPPPAHNGTTDKINMDTVTQSALPVPRMRPQPAPIRQRIDHLAGLTAMCSLVVTLMHFCLTFVPAAAIPGAPQHARSEYWAQKIIAPFLLNQMWLGVFFTTSVRFLTAPYLRRGKIEDVAKAAVRRTPRLMIPVASIALLEYFFIDIGATRFLQYIPSLTWSTWPYVTRYDNFGQYISEVLELVFLIPNAVPQITLHYCTGVLWTIAVQLQGSWLVLLGAIVVYEIKTPWKRMSFYIFCLINHWYAQSWGTYLWFGLLLTDLDVTYKYKTYLSTRPLAYYPLITFCWLCVAAGFAVNLVPNWTSTDFNFATSERNIHPDPSSGDALMNTENAGYPPYYTPRLNGLLFAGGMQAIVELSSAVQWLLSTPPFLVLFPHVFTIYLMHGLVFWSWGSWLMVFLAERNFDYGVNVTVVGITSYAILFLSLPVITPVLEALGKDITALVWMTAQEKSPPRRRTLFPFPENLFTGRQVNAKVGQQGDVEAGMGNGTIGSGSVRSSITDEKHRSGATAKETELHAISR